MNKSTNEIRQLFLNFFQSKGHKIVNSSSLIPLNDPTLLFTNAGMNQFKNIFLGYEQYYCSRVVTAQRCVRAGGKHNDLDNVGYTKRHHTFFEMLGNFSFGDYFKKLAIIYAWELLNSRKWFNLPKERLWVTVYKNDEETYNIWKNDIKISSDHIICIGDNRGKIYESDNFWQMGDIGPCGPCTEIFYDYGEHIPGGLPGSLNEGERYVEIWNIVFMQFNRQADGTMKPLPNPAVDTGMGLERIASVLQNVHSNYEIDLFQELIHKISMIIDIAHSNRQSLYVIADHIRSCAFLIADGVLPSNDNRGYVLRRIIRRAIRHGNMLGVKNIFFYKLVAPLIEVMSNQNNNIKHKQHHIEEILKIEEEQFIKTLKRGLDLLNNQLSSLKSNVLDGNIAFNLYDTFGFPLDLTMDICREKNITVDKNSFDLAMLNQRNKAKKANFILKHNYELLLSNLINVKSIFKGYETLSIKSTIQAIFIDGKKVNQLIKDQKGIIILDQTSFYSESGGQIGDSGILEGENGIFNVSDTKKFGYTIFHIGILTHGYLKENDSLYSKVNKEFREKISCNHSAVHLLHATLRKVLGNHVIQKGSLINAKSLRFDFLHHQALTLQEINTIENIINDQIRQNYLISVDFLSLYAAKQKGAIALFEDKYNDDKVRMVCIDKCSKELCCGTHAKNTGNIGFFNILFDSSISSGIRRIEALTGEQAVFQFQKQKNYLYSIADLLKLNNFNNINDKISDILKYLKKLEKQVNKINHDKIIQDSISLIDKTITIQGIKLLIHHFNETEKHFLLSIIDYIKNKLGTIIIIFSVTNNNKTSLIIGVTNNLINRIQANVLIDKVANKYNIKGGGRPNIAIAGICKVTLLHNIIEELKNLISYQL